MSFSLTTQAFTLGENTSNTFVFTETYLPDSSQIDYGRFFIAMAAPDYTDGEKIAQQLLISIKSIFYKDTTRDPYESFELLLKDLNEKIPPLCKNTSVNDLDIMLCVSSDAMLHLTQSGKAGLFLLRGNQLTHISEELSDNQDPKVFSNISSGQLANNDILVLATGNVYKALDEQHFIKVLKKSDFSNMHNELDSLDFLGLMCLKFSETFTAAAPVQTVPETYSETPETPSYTNEQPTQLLPPEKSLWQKFSEFFLGSGRDDVIDENATIDLQAQSGAMGGLPSGQQTKLQNTVEIVKINVSKNWERLFNRRKGLLSNRNNRPMLIWFLIIAIILVGVGFWWNAKFKENQRRAEYEQRLAAIQTDYGSAETKAIYDKEIAKNLLVKLKGDTQAIIDEAPDDALKNQATIEMERINQLLDKVDNVHRISSAQIAYHLADKRPNIQALGIATINDDVYVYDFNAVYKLMLDAVDMRKIDLGDDTPVTVQAASGFNTRDSIVFVTQDRTLIEFEDDNFRVMESPEDTWKPAVALADYGNYMYFLDPLDNEIWRYIRGNAGYDGPIKKNPGQDVSKGVDMAIDGAIYVLNSTGEIIKSYANEPQNFSYSGLVEPMNNPSRLFADSNPDNGSLYILDQNNHRVVVTSKTGSYEAQYLFDQSEELVDVFINETTKKLLVLTKNGKVYELDLIY